MGKQERLERKGDKSADQANRETEELLGKNLILFEQYIKLQGDSSDVADKQRADLKKEFHKHQPFADFEKAVANYMVEHQPGTALRNREGPDLAIPGTPGAPAENREDVITGTKLSLQELKDRIENYSENENSSLLAVQRLLDRDLTPVDLRGGARQNDAIDAVFGNNPNVAYTLKLEKGGEYSAILNSVADSLSKTFERMRELEKGHEVFQEDVVTKFLSNRWDNLKDAFVENPVASLLALGATVGVSWFVYKNVGETGQKAMKWGAGLVGATWGINHITGMLSDDGKSALSRMFWNANTFDQASVMKKYHGKIDTMNDGNRHATDAMLHLGDSRASAIAAAFENALRTGSHKIDPYDIVGEGNISPDQARRINQEGMYLGLENLMYEIAEKK
ncbi:MAG: hypothetical protein AAB802_02605, partial [Patescibacteria group bacterium]